MKDLPGIVFIIDTRKEAIAVAEAKRMGIPIIAIVDTNCNPDGIDYPIPGNDDAIRAITLFTQIVANAVIEAENTVGLEVIETLQDDESEEDQYENVVDKDEEGEEAEAEEEVATKENVETVALGERVGKAEEATEEPADESGFTAEDYSDFNPDAVDKKNPHEQENAPDSEVLLEQNVEDEDKLYEE